jgi:hypothetical protein
VGINEVYPAHVSLFRAQRTSALQGRCTLGTGERELSQSGTFWITAILVVSLFSGCSGGELPVANTSGFDYREVALQFTKALTERDYDRAYAMTSQDYQRRTSVKQLRTAFEAIVPTDWGAIGPVTVVRTMTQWQSPAKQPSDLGWVYVSIGGDVYSEAVIAIVTLENRQPKVREVEFGRP